MEKKNNNTAFRWTMGSIGMLVIILLSFIYSNSGNEVGETAMTLKSLILYIIGTIFIFGVAWFVTEKFFLKSKVPEELEKKELPKPVTIAERKKFIEKILKDEYGNYVIDWITEKTWEKGEGIKSLIHAFFVGVYYENRVNPNHSRYLIVINCHNPSSKRNIIPIDKTSSVEEVMLRAEELAESLADNPGEQIKFREATHTDLTTGRQTFLKEPVIQQKQEEKKEGEEQPEK